MKTDMDGIIKRIKGRRLELGYSFQDLAEKTNMSKSTLQRYETGAIKNVPLDRLEVLAKALIVTPAYLMGWEEEKAPSAPLQTPDLSEQIKKAYGEEPYEALQSFHQLDAIDRAEIRGEMKQMLKADKYAAKKGFSNGQAM